MVCETVSDRCARAVHAPILHGCHGRASRSQAAATTLSGSSAFEPPTELNKHGHVTHTDVRDDERRLHRRPPRRGTRDSRARAAHGGGLVAGSRPLHREMGRVIVGQRALVDRLLLGLLTNGHILLEGVPGLAKTLALKTLAGMHPRSALRAHSVHARHAPVGHHGDDHLPRADLGHVSGQARARLREPRPRRRDQPRAGEGAERAARGHAGAAGHAGRRRRSRCPIRSSSSRRRTRSSRRGPIRSPRRRSTASCSRCIVRYPSVAEERAILDAMAVTTPRLAVSPVATLDAIVRSRRVVDEVYVDDAIRDYIVRIVAATREPERYNVPIRGLVRAGASPRGTIALTLAARGWAFLQGRGYVVPEDVKALAPDVLRHRITLSFDAEAQGDRRRRDRPARPRHGGVAMNAHARELRRRERISENVRRIEIRTRRLSNDCVPGRRAVALSRARDGLRRAPRIRARRRRSRHRLERVGAHRSHLRQEVPRGAPAHGRLRRRHERVGRARRRARRPSASRPSRSPGCSRSRRCAATTASGSCSSPTRVEKFIPPARGRAHTRRLVRDLVAFEPKGRGTRPRRRRCGRCASGCTGAPSSSSSRTSSWAPRTPTETRLELAGARAHGTTSSAFAPGTSTIASSPSSGFLTLEDAETGEVVELDTGSARQRAALAKAVQRDGRTHSRARPERRARTFSRSTRCSRTSGRSSGSSSRAGCGHEPSPSARDERSPARRHRAASASALASPRRGRRHPRHSRPDPDSAVVALAARDRGRRGRSLAVVLLVRWWRTRAPRALSPLERARQALAAAEAHARGGRAHEWADIVAETLRGALAARLGADVLPQTTAELCRGAVGASRPLADELDARRASSSFSRPVTSRGSRRPASTRPRSSASTATARELVERLFAPPPPTPGDGRRATADGDPMISLAHFPLHFVSTRRRSCSSSRSRSSRSGSRVRGRASAVAYSSTDLVRAVASLAAHALGRFLPALRWLGAGLAGRRARPPGHRAPQRAGAGLGRRHHARGRRQRLDAGARHGRGRPPARRR